jgi:hypothetical protein
MLRTLIAIPVIFVTVMLQSALISHMPLLSGYADLPLVMLAAWAMQDQVDTAYHWAVATGVLVGFVSGLTWLVPVISYLAVVALAQAFQRRVWQAPLLAMFSVTFVGLALSLGGTLLPIPDVLGLLVLPGTLLNMLLVIPVYVVMRDLARWAYPASEVE